MDYPFNVDSVHIELTNKCQASCPMCARNHNGGKEREHLNLDEITLEKFIKWFPVDFLEKLRNFYACGNYGDPIIAQDCLEIFEYIRSNNQQTRLAIHTNGSARNVDWWKRLAKILGKNSVVVFAIDGFKGQHELYRRGTNFDKIIENAEAFISAGGIARADSLVFEHNEHSVKDLEKFLKGIGFDFVNFKSTKRFYGNKQFPVYKQDGKFDYNLNAAKTGQWRQEFKINIDNLLSKSFVSKMKENAVIKPECVKLKQVYIDTHGNFFPCCWIGFDYIDEPEHDNESSLITAKNNVVRESKKILETVSVPNLKDRNILEVINDGKLWKDLHELWKSNDKPLQCVKSCSTTLYDTLYTHSKSET